MKVFDDLPNRNYLICKEINNKFNKRFDIGGYKFQYKDSSASQVIKKDKNIIVFGEVINTRKFDATIYEILEELLETNNLIDLINVSKRLAGRFILVYYSREGFFIIPDASTSIIVAYTTIENELYVSSNPKIIADVCGFDESTFSKGIKKSAAESHPLPYDLTMYDNIKVVIPNHFLNVKGRTAIRYYPLSKNDDMTTTEVAELSSKIIRNTIKGYHRKHKLSLPITAGVDSRTILSASKDLISQIPTYTFFHDNFNDRTADILIPVEMSAKFKFKHFVFKDMELPRELVEFYIEKVGGNLVKSEVRNAWTYFNSEIKEHAMLNGGISPLAKSGFGKNLPEFLSTPTYLVTKTHNYSKDNYQEVKRWVGDVSKHSHLSNISKYDLFFWEHRVGKWTTNSYMNADILVDLLNPFNCRELIEAWLRVPRRNRMNGVIHKQVIKINWPELLEYPINPDAKYDFVEKNSLLFYFGTYIKYFMERNKH